MLVFRSAAFLIALVMMSAPGTALGQSQPAGIAPEHREMAAKRAKERERVDNCQRQATEQKILPRDRPQFVINCLDGAAERNQPSVVAPEYQELAARRAREKERVDNCQRQATEQRVLPRDRTQFLINCLGK
jgi:CRISPR/Cas system-associated protein Csm6